MARALTREEEKELRRQQRREERREQRRAERRARRAERDAEAVIYHETRGRDRSRSRSRSRSREHGPSRPTGRWTEEERRQGWLLTRSTQWAANGRVRIDDKAGFLERGAAWLEWWKARSASEEIATSERKAFMERMYDLATSHGHVCGKWMVFAPVSVVDALWADIVEANVAGRLGGCCKVCAHNRVSDTHLICVYCRDFNDVRECQRVLYNLHNICASHGVRIIANFKADFLTALGVYKSASPNVQCTFTLRELRLVKEWPNRRLKRILDNLKRQVRMLEAQRDEEERAMTPVRTRTRSRSRPNRS